MPLSGTTSPPTYRFPSPSPVTWRMLRDFAMRAAIGLMLGPIAAYMAMSFWLGIGVLFCDSLEAANMAIARADHPVFGVVIGAVLASGVAAVMAPIAKGQSRSWPLVKCFAASGIGLLSGLIMGSLTGLAISAWLITPTARLATVEFVGLLVGALWTGLICGILAGKRLRDPDVIRQYREQARQPRTQESADEPDPFGHLLDQPERQLQHTGEEAHGRVGDGGRGVDHHDRVSHGAGDANFEQFVREVVGDL